MIVSALLYYGLDTPLMSDAEFDEGCNRLAAEWDKLDPIRQWQLGSAEEIHTTGVHVKVTRAAAGAAVTWLEDNHKLIHPVVMTRKGGWHRDRKHKVDWLLPADFAFNTLAEFT